MSRATRSSTRSRVTTLLGRRKVKRMDIVEVCEIEYRRVGPLVWKELCEVGGIDFQLQPMAFCGLGFVGDGPCLVIDDLPEAICPPHDMVDHAID
jgi:hypothetical protein